MPAVTTPTPAARPPRAVTVRAPLGADRFVEFSARLLPVHLDAEVLRSSWFVTHGLGTIAGGTYTEVRIPLHVDDAGDEVPEHVLDAIVRQVAVELYERRWAFHYRPNDYAEAIERWNLRRREVVVVDGIEVQ